jgi:signal transduction histidine kinase
MKAIPSIDLLEAAAYALVGERCRQSYLHDIRGGLQSLHTAVELLVRAAMSTGENPALAEKATAIARRAVQNHEKSLAELLDQLTPSKETAATVNVGEVVSEVLRFIINEASGKSISFRFEPAPEVLVVAQPRKLRLLILGLSSSLIDAAAPRAVIDVAVARENRDAMIEFRSSVPCPALRSPEDLWHSGGAMSSPYELLLVLTQSWASTNGGRLERPTDAHLPHALRIYYPLASS